MIVLEDFLEPLWLFGDPEQVFLFLFLSPFGVTAMSSGRARNPLPSARVPDLNMLREGAAGSAAAGGGVKPAGNEVRSSLNLFSTTPPPTQGTDTPTVSYTLLLSFGNYRQGAQGGGRRPPKVPRVNPVVVAAGNPAPPPPQPPPPAASEQMNLRSRSPAPVAPAGGRTRSRSPSLSAVSNMLHTWVMRKR